MTELNYLDITKAGDGHIKVPSIGLISPAITENIAKTALASISDGAEGIPVKSLIADINPVQTGSGDPSPSNVRPITGWTGMNVYRTGANLWDEEWELGGFNSSGGETSDTNCIRSKNYIGVQPNTAYHFTNKGTDVFADMVFYDNNKNVVLVKFGASGGIHNNVNFTTPNNAYYIRFGMAPSYGATYGNNISINYPSTDHDYHKGTDNTTYPISWEDEAGTVYGGTLDVTTGLLTVDMASVDLGTLTWGASSSANCFYASTAPQYALGDVRMLCSNYAYTGARTSAPYYGDDKTIQAFYRGNESSPRELYAHDSAYSTAAAFQTAMSGVQLVYELATPVTYQLTPQAVLTILGQNNIWADTGDVEVSYVADTKMYIDKVLTE